MNLEDLAREVGMAAFLRAHVIVIATTGRFTTPVHEYAAELARNTPLQVVLVSGEILERCRLRGRQVVTDYFWQRAREAMRAKRSQVDRPLKDLAGGT